METVCTCGAKLDPNSKIHLSLRAVETFGGKVDHYLVYTVASIINAVMAKDAGLLRSN